MTAMKTMCAVVLLSVSGLSVYGMPPDLELVRQRVVAQLLEANPDDRRVERLLEELDAQGSWPAINYVDVSLTGFQHREHTGHLLSMARAYGHPDSRFHQSAELLAALERALSFWVEHDFIGDNWWHNQIGTPEPLVHVLLILGDELPPDLVAQTLPIVGRAHLNASGARPSGDRIKIAGILAKQILFRGDAQRFEEVMEVIEGEIKFSAGPVRGHPFVVTSPGLQHDFSFHHRTDGVNNTLGYGVSYAASFAEWAAYVAGTRYAFSDEKLSKLIDFYLDGVCKMMVYSRYPDPGATNRGISRPGALRARSPALPERLLQAGSYRRAELEAVIAARRGEPVVPVRHSTFFPRTEYYSHQRENYFASVRMFSARSFNMEVPYNSEGILSYHFGDGANFTTRTGEEYVDVWPVYDWQKIPGATVLQKETFPPDQALHQRGSTDFVGAVTDGEYGAAVFDFASPHDPVTARKAWFFFDDQYVALGAGIHCPDPAPVVTTLNQARRRGTVTATTAAGRSELDDGLHVVDAARAIHHDGMGYVFPQPATVHVRVGPATGRWYDINRGFRSDRSELSLDVFTLWIDHGGQPRDEGYAYVVYPAIDEADLPARVAAAPVRVLANTPERQAVAHPQLGVYQAVFHAPGRLELSDALTLELDAPGMVLVRMDGSRIARLAVSDPSRKRDHLTLTVNTELPGGDDEAVRWDAGRGTTVLRVALPRTVHAGETVVMDF